jgi:Flp pilus assembly protein TadG
VIALNPSSSRRLYNFAIADMREGRALTMKKPSFIFPRKRCLRRNEDGSAAVEFALVALPFLACLFAIIEVGLVFLAGQVLETAVGDASRMILTGQMQSQSQGLTPEQAVAKFKDQICTTSVKTLFTCDNIQFDVQPVSSWSPTSNPNAPSASGVLNTPLINPTTKQLNTANFTYNPGTQCQIVVVRVAYEWPTFVPTLGLDLANLADGNHLLTSTAVFRNEPYSGTGFC